jgi:hypothetical protein
MLINPKLNPYVLSEVAGGGRLGGGSTYAAFCDGIQLRRQSEEL